MKVTKNENGVDSCSANPYSNKQADAPRSGLTVHSLRATPLRVAGNIVL